jgi:hypothetical protein
MLFGVSSTDRQSIINNTLAFAKAAQVFGRPVVLSTVETKSFSGYMWPRLAALFPGRTPIERSSMNAWDDKNFVAAIEKTGKKKIVLAGLWTETCVALPTIQAIFPRPVRAKAVKRTPTVRDMLSTGLPVGAGTDATRVASYNPFVCLYWLVTGKTMGGLSMYDDNNRLDRMEALRLWTVGSSWFSTEQGSKGAIVPGQLADVAVLSSDYFAVPDEEIKQLESVLTIVGGAPVYGAEEFEDLAPPALPVLPEWSPVAAYGGYAKPTTVTAAHHRTSTPTHVHADRCKHNEFGGGFGCLCWAF